MHPTKHHLTSARLACRPAPGQFLQRHPAPAWGSGAAAAAGNGPPAWEQGGHERRRTRRGGSSSLPQRRCGWHGCRRRWFRAVPHRRAGALPHALQPGGRLAGWPLDRGCVQLQLSVLAGVCDGHACSAPGLLQLAKRGMPTCMRPRAHVLGLADRAACSSGWLSLVARRAASDPPQHPAPPSSGSPPCSRKMPLRYIHCIPCPPSLPVPCSRGRRAGCLPG